MAAAILSATVVELPVNFWATLTFVAGKTRTPGWRPDFFYLDEPEHGWFIWTVRCIGDEWGLAALSQTDWSSIHGRRIFPGAGFRLQEGRMLVAVGEVTRVERRGELESSVET